MKINDLGLSRQILTVLINLNVFGSQSTHSKCFYFRGTAWSQIKHSVTQVTGLHSPSQWNPTARLIPDSAFHSTLSDLSVASCLLVQLPHLLYSNGQCPVTNSITHYWWGGPVTQLHIKKCPISSHHALETSLSKIWHDMQHLCCFF